MDKRYDVTALGELLVDFTMNGLSSQNNPLYEANPGGAPCNVLAMLGKLGKKTAFIGKVGDDMFGQMLAETVKSVGIDVSGLVVSKEERTTLAFVKTFENGDREFSFYRNPGADMCLREDEVDEKLIEASRIFHFGSLSMTHEGVRCATKKALKAAKDKGLLISFDPNLRPPLWENLETARDMIDYGLSVCHILKIADNEIEFMTGCSDFYEGAAILRERYPNIMLLNVTAGASGSYSFYKDYQVFVPAFKLGGTIETTGAGDTFCASVLNFVLEHGIDHLKEEDLIQMLRFANAAAYLVTTKKGAIRSMPQLSQVAEILEL